MSYGAGSLAIVARRAGPRTILERLRYDGISRCSRAFRDGDAARIMLSQLGPGVVRGDAVTTSGDVQADAHLIVTSQAATRLLGGVAPSTSHANWKLADGAILELLGEPLVADDTSAYSATTKIDLGSNAYVLISDLAHVSAGATVRLSTTVWRAGEELYYDAIDAGACAPQAVGTFALVGLATPWIDALCCALDALTSRPTEMMLGVGVLPTGIFVRIAGFDLWAVRSLLAQLRTSAWQTLRAHPNLSA